MMQCPKCHAQMHTYNRNGVQIEQCSGCRGIFLDFGELEALTRLESQWTQQAPPAPQAPQAYPAAGPAWGAPQQGQHGGGHYGHHRQKSFGRMLFSS
ncbi:zf-TFIIB domain-containing protein [Streptomyces sp. NBC_01218]|uniref:TFIIB-type zinc ribbon-containing protein n=1 Tax=unclassified Streptomyces TaxID=2593676 RepID=UPI0023B955E6|nr:MULTISPECIES: zf-TFIIB domain-containing protein [unclassified Streptomyces]WEH42784.1 zf-TFIIB domain-containing protein [Streptomyces sp. AM 2-1-1]WSQ54420.1 zf-TFIIB domain-containing protein [Streptomyces sp. NBC_01218]